MPRQSLGGPFGRLLACSLLDHVDLALEPVVGGAGDGVDAIAGSGVVGDVVVDAIALDLVAAEEAAPPGAVAPRLVWDQDVELIGRGCCGARGGGVPVGGARGGERVGHLGIARGEVRGAQAGGRAGRRARTVRARSTVPVPEVVGTGHVTLRLQGPRRPLFDRLLATVIGGAL